MASSTESQIYEVKTSKQEAKELLGFFWDDRKVLGDDPRIQKDRAKPAPDIYLIALQTLNSEMGSNPIITANECLVFEDSVAGVEAGRRG